MQDAPGVKNDAVDEEPDPIKRRCIRVYEKAHEAVTVELKALYSKLDTKARTVFARSCLECQFSAGYKTGGR